MMEHMAALLRDPRISSDSDLSKLLEQCILTTKRLSANIKLDEIFDRRDWAELAWTILTDMGAAKRAARWAALRIGRKGGRSAY